MNRKKRIWNRTALLFAASYLMMMLVPLAVSMGYYYPKTSEMLIANKLKQDEAAVEQVMKLTDRELTTILSMPTYIFNHQRILLKTLETDTIAIKNAQEDLTQMLRANNFIPHMFIYMRESDYFIGIHGSSFYLEDMKRQTGIYETSFGYWRGDSLREAMRSASGISVTLMPDVVVGGRRYAQALLFTMPMPPGSYARATVMVCIPDVQMRSLAQNDGDGPGGAVFVDHTGSPVFATGEMTDTDWEKINGAIQGANPSSGYEQLPLSNGETLVTWRASNTCGWTYIQLSPLSGVLDELSQLSCQALVLTMVVLLVGLGLILVFMRMTYVPIRKLAGIAKQESLSSSQSDFEMISTLITSLNTQKDTLQAQLGSMEPRMRDYIIREILSGPPEQVGSCLGQAELYDLRFEAEAYQVLVCQFETAQQAQNALSRLEERAKDAPVRLLCAQIARVEQLEIILMFKNPNDICPEIEKWAEPFWFMGAGRRVQRPQELATGFSQALAVMDYLHFNDLKNTFMPYEALPERVFNPRSYPLSVMQALESAINHANAEQVQVLMRQIDSLILIEGAPPYYTRSVYFNVFNLLISGLSCYLGADNEAVTEIGKRSMLSHYSAHEMVNILDATAQQLIALLEMRKASYTSVTRAVEYIDRHYASSMLNLQELADLMGLSPSSCSRVFKEKVGKSFKEYVDAVRMFHAKKMLCESNEPIEKIALDVGYETVTSFYRLFKKQTGEAPGEYRQNHRKPSL